MTSATPEFVVLGPFPIPPRIQSGILRTVHEAGDQEACGLLLGLDHEIRAWYPCRNAHAEPTRAFLLHPHDLRQALELALRLGLQVLGLWHSHPHGPSLLSDEDRAGTPSEWLQWLVVPRSG